MDEIFLPSPIETMVRMGRDGKLESDENARKPILPLGKDLKDMQMHGTTTLSFKFSGGIIVAADSRASMGDYVASRSVEKIIPVTKNIIATMAGGAADCTQFIKWTAANMRILEMNLGLETTVHTLARLFTSQMRKNKGTGLSVGTMMSGYDERDGFSIYYLDSDGTCLQGDMFCIGSGSTMAYAVLDTAFKEFKNEKEGDKNISTSDKVNSGKFKGRMIISEDVEAIRKEEVREIPLNKAIDTAVQAIRHAAHRDSYSGGFINVYHINATGAHHVFREDSRKIPVAGGEFDIPPVPPSNEEKSAH